MVCLAQPSCSPGNGQGRWEQPHREGAHCSEESPKSFLFPLLAPCNNTFWDVLVSQMAPKTSQRCTKEQSTHHSAHHPLGSSCLCLGTLVFPPARNPQASAFKCLTDGAGAEQSQVGSLELGIQIQNWEENPAIPQACLPGRGQDASLLFFPLNELPEFSMSWNPTHHPWTASGSQLLSKSFSDRVHQAGFAQPL